MGKTKSDWVNSDFTNKEESVHVQVIRWLIESRESKKQVVKYKADNLKLRHEMLK